MLVSEAVARKLERRRHALRLVSEAGRPRAGAQMHTKASAVIEVPTASTTWTDS